MVLGMDNAQRRDIDTTLDDRLTLAIDEENIADNPYIFEPVSFQGNNWFKQGNNIVKLNLAEQDSLIFLSSPLVKLLQKDITNVIVSFDYQVSNVSVNYPILSNISLTCMEMTNYMLVENILTTQGHIDVDCSLFNFSSNVVNTSISEQGFKVGINFNGNKSNATIKLSNVQIQFKYNNKLLSESDSVINRLEPYVDFYRDEDGDLVLQIGGDASGKGIDHSGGDIDTYSKTEIDNKLATKVNVEIGKGLSSNDYTLTEKTKLGTIESNANYYVHPSSHQTGMITEQSALTNLETSENATQHEINLAIDDKINQGSGVDIVTQWESTPSDSKVASEKLTKDSLDGKANSTHTHTKSEITDLGTIPSASSTVPSADTINGSYGSGTSYARSNHSHPKSSLYAESSHTHSNYANKVHTHTETDITDFPTLSPVATSGSYNDLYNKPSIPSSSSDLSDGSDLVKTSDTVGLLKNDGDVDTTTYQTVDNKVNSWSSTPSNGKYPSEKLVKDNLDKKIDKSIVQGLVKNDGTIDTTQYLSQHQDISGKEDVSNKVTSWHQSPNNYSYPSEKLVKDSLNGKSDTSHTHSIYTISYTEDLVWKSETDGLLKSDGSVDTTTYLPSTSLSNYVQKSQTSGLLKNDGTIDTTQYLSQHQDISGKEDVSNKVTSWSNTTTDTHYPSEKLVKDTIDLKQPKLFSGANIKTINHNSILGSGNLNVGGGYNTVYFDACNNSTKLSNYNKTGSANLTMEHTGDTHYYVKLTRNNTATWTVNNVNVSNKARITAEWYMCSNTTIKPKLLIYDPTLQNGYSAEINKNLSTILIGTHTLSSFGSMIATDSQETSSATWYKLEFIIDRELLTFNLYDNNGVLLGSVDGVGSLNLSESGNLVGFGLEYNSGSDAYIRNIKVEDWDANSVNVDIVTSWETIPSDNSVASEKLVKDSLDGKANSTHSHTTNDITNFPTIPTKTSDLTNDSNYITSSALTGYQTTSNLVTSFSSTTSDSKYPSEKLTKTSLDSKVDKVTGKGLSSNDFTNNYKSTMDSLKTVATTGSYNDLTDKPTIPSAITVDSALSSTSTNPVQNKVINTALGNKANSTHTHTKSQITDFPTIPTKTSDLSNDGADGTNVFVANNDSRLSDVRNPKPNVISPSSTNTVDLNTYTTTGLYYMDANANAQYVSNRPQNIELAFSLIVEKQTTNGVKQTLTYYDYPNLPRTFIRVRHYNNNYWTEWAEVDYKGLKDGGANLLEFNGFSTSNANATVTDDGFKNGSIVYSINNTSYGSSAYTDIVYSLPIDVQEYGGKYTVSFYAKASANTQIKTYLYGTNNFYRRYRCNSTVDTNVGSFGDGATRFDLTTSWQKFWITYEATTDTTLSIVKKNLDIRCYGGSNVQVACIKLEKGENATDYTQSRFGEPIPYNANLNNYTVDGHYRSMINAHSVTMYNTPWQRTPNNKGYAFSMTVEHTTSNGVRQRLIRFGQHTPYEYVRNMYNNVWGEWKAVDKQPYIEGNCSSTSGTGTGGYAKLLDIYINSTYYNSPITFDIYQRGKRPLECMILFNNQNTKNPTINKFEYIGDSQNIYLCNESEQHYVLYVQKTETNDAFTLQNFKFNDRFTGEKLIFTSLEQEVTSANMPYQSSSNYNSGANDKKASQIWQRYLGGVTPTMNGTANVGTSTQSARSDHTHPSDTSKVNTADLFDLIYPVGSIYMSINSTDPSTLFGGTWTQIKDTFLLACGDTYSNGATGGSADAIVVEHTHTQEQHRHEVMGSKSAGLSSGNYLRAGYGSTKDSKYTDYDTPTINPTGVDGTGKNMPPYMSVYMWKRTS